MEGQRIPPLRRDRAPTEQGNSSGEDCDALAGDPFDPEGNGPGVLWGRLRYEEAIRACTDAVAKQPDEPRLRYQLGRAQEWYYRFIDDEKLKEKLRQEFEGNYRAAIDQNRSIALYAVAKLEDTSPEQTISLLQRANEGGVVLAARALSQHYASGEGVAKDSHEALRWLEVGAAKGDPWAQTDLGRMYWQGDKDFGIGKNWQLALFHFTLAVRLFEERGYGDSEEIAEPMLYRANLARRLPMDKVAAIWEAAQAWKEGEPAPAFGPATSPTPGASPRPAEIGAAVP